MKYIGLFDEKEDIVTKEKLDAKQDKITVNGIVQGDGNGNVSAAQTVNGETIELNAASVGLGNVDNVKQYSATNPPPYPVTSVNTKIGAVTLSATDVGAQASITASGILKGNGAGGISKAVADRDYATCTNLRNGSADESLQTLSSQSEGWSAMAEGINTTASGIASHAEGSGTIASGNVSHTEGSDVIANHRSQHAQGEYNIADDSTADATERGNYAHIVGNGTSIDARSNAHTLDWSGNAWFAGDVYVGSTSGTNKDDGSKKLITADEVPSEVFIATYDTTTYTEIKAAYDADKVVLCRDGNSLVPLSFCTRSVAVFSSCSQGIVTTLSRYRSDSFGWTKGTETIVPDTRTINGKALSADITLGASDVDALPNVSVTTADNGKFLRVVNGAWAADSVPNANGGAF